MDSPRTRIYTHPFFEATPPGAAPGPPVKNRVPVFATSGGVITAALLSPRCMQVAVSMEKLSRTCFAGGGANVLELRRSLLLEAGSVR